MTTKTILTMNESEILTSCREWRRRTFIKTITLLFSGLRAQDPCSEGLALFMSIARLAGTPEAVTLPPAGQEWQEGHWQLADLWLRCTPYYFWLCERGWPSVCLAGAYLARAYLARANLARAHLARANLARANLAGANLAGAYLAGAIMPTKASEAEAEGADGAAS